MSWLSLIHILGMIADIWGGFIGNPSGITVFSPADWGYQGVPDITLEVLIAVIFLGIVFTISAIRGISAIEKIAKVVCPLILLVAIIAGIGMINEGGGVSSFINKASELDGLGLGTGITAVVGSWVAGAVMGVDMFLSLIHI